LAGAAEIALFEDDFSDDWKILKEIFFFTVFVDVEYKLIFVWRYNLCHWKSVWNQTIIFQFQSSTLLESSFYDVASTEKIVRLRAYNSKWFNT
jgi:hypothetical protein